MKILLVDDEADYLRTMSRTLEVLGHDVRAATSVATAFASLLVWTPSVVLLDVRLDREDGFDLLREMRVHQVATPVVMISGYPDLRDAHEARRAGVVRYLSKPVDMADLEEALEAACGTRS